MRCLLCTIVAAVVSVVPWHPAVSVISARIAAAFSEASSPWSITFTTSAGPTRLSVICNPPLPQPLATGISREENGTWYPGIATALSNARRISRLEASSR